MGEHQAVGDDRDLQRKGVFLDPAQQELVILRFAKDRLACDAAVVDVIVVALSELHFAVGICSPWRYRCQVTGRIWSCRHSCATSWRRKCLVIPVILPEDVPSRRRNCPSFWQDMTWVDFRRKDPDPLERLVWGITGERGRGFG